MDYTCVACNKRNCRLWSCVQRAVTERQTQRQRDDLKLFKYHLCEGARLAGMRSTPLFRNRTLTYDAIKKLTSDGTWMSPQWLAPLARVKSLQSAFDALQANKITAAEFAQQLEEAFSFFCRTVQLDYRHPLQGGDALLFHLEWYARMANDGCAAETAYSLLLHDDTERNIFNPLTVPEPSPPPEPTTTAPPPKKPKKVSVPRIEVLTPKQIKNAPYTHWVRPIPIPKGLASRPFKGCAICRFFQSGTCRRKFHTCTYVHECKNCHELGHPEPLCPSKK